MTGSTLKDALPKTIRTARLTLAAQALADLDELVVLADNKRVADNLSRLPHPYTREDGKAFINRIGTHGNDHPYAIRNEDGAFIGITGLTIEDGKLPEMGYWLGEPFWGCGYATEAAHGLIDAVRNAGAETVFARALFENSGSRNVLKKLGFIEIGEHVGDCGPHKDRRIVELRLEFER